MGKVTTILAVFLFVLAAVLTPRWLSAARAVGAAGTAQAATDAGALQQAAMVLRAASDRRPADPRLAARAGESTYLWSLWGGGHEAAREAAALLRRAVANDPLDSASFATLAEIHLAQRRPHTAWDALQAALAHDPWNDAYLDLGATVLDRLDRPHEAADMRALARSLRAAP